MVMQFTVMIMQFMVRAEGTFKDGHGALGCVHRAGEGRLKQPGVSPQHQRLPGH